MESNVGKRLLIITEYNPAKKTGVYFSTKLREEYYINEGYSVETVNFVCNNSFSLKDSVCLEGADIVYNRGLISPIRTWGEFEKYRPMIFRRLVKPRANLQLYHFFEQFDVLMFSWGGIPLILLSSGFKICSTRLPKIFIFFHGSDLNILPKESVVRRSILKDALNSCDGSIVLTNDSKSYLSGLTAAPVLRSANGIRFVHEHNFAKQKVNRFVFIGNLELVKGVKRLIDLVQVWDMSAELHIYGSGSFLANLEMHVDRNLKVTLFGYRDQDEILDKIGPGDCLLLLSYSEGSPMVVPEALSRGAFVLCTQVGNLPELLAPRNLINEPYSNDKLIEICENLILEGYESKEVNKILAKYDLNLILAKEKAFIEN